MFGIGKSVKIRERRAQILNVIHSGVPFYGDQTKMSIWNVYAKIQSENSFSITKIRAHNSETKRTEVKYKKRKTTQKKPTRKGNVFAKQP